MTTLTVIETKERNREDGTRDILVRYRAGHYTIDKTTTIFEKYPDKPLIIFSVSHDKKEYLPDIYCITKGLTYDIADFEVQTTAYGTLEAEEISKVIAGYQEAQELALTLRKMFVEEA